MPGHRTYLLLAKEGIRVRDRLNPAVIEGRSSGAFRGRGGARPTALPARKG